MIALFVCLFVCLFLLMLLLLLFDDWFSASFFSLSNFQLNWTYVSYVRINLVVVIVIVVHGWLIVCLVFACLLLFLLSFIHSFILLLLSLHFILRLVSFRLVFIFLVFVPLLQEYWPVFRLTAFLHQVRPDSLHSMPYRLVVLLLMRLLMRRLMKTVYIWWMSLANDANRADHEVVANHFQFHELLPSIDCIVPHRILSFSLFYVQQLKIVYLLLLANYIPVEFGMKKKRTRRRRWNKHFY